MNILFLKLSKVRPACQFPLIFLDHLGCFLLLIILKYKLLNYWLGNTALLCLLFTSLFLFVISVLAMPYSLPILVIYLKVLTSFKTQALKKELSFKSTYLVNIVYCVYQSSSLLLMLLCDSYDSGMLLTCIEPHNRKALYIFWSIKCFK